MFYHYRFLVWMPDFLRQHSYMLSYLLHNIPLIVSRNGLGSFHCIPSWTTREKSESKHQATSGELSSKMYLDMLALSDLSLVVGHHDNERDPVGVQYASHGGGHHESRSTAGRHPNKNYSSISTTTTETRWLRLPTILVDRQDQGDVLDSSSLGRSCLSSAGLS